MPFHMAPSRPYPIILGSILLADTPQVSQQSAAGTVEVEAGTKVVALGIAWMSLFVSWALQVCALRYGATHAVYGTCVPALACRHACMAQKGQVA